MKTSLFSCQIVNLSSPSIFKASFFFLIKKERGLLSTVLAAYNENCNIDVSRWELCLTNYCLQVRVQAIRGLPLFCKDTPEHLSKIVDILVQLLTAGIEIY